MGYKWSIRFSDPVDDLCMKQFWSVFLDGFFENSTEDSQKSEVCSKLFRSTQMFTCWRARKPRTRIKAEASCPNKRVRKRDDTSKTKK